MTDLTLPAERPVQAAASQGTIVEQTRAAAEVAAAVKVARDFPRDAGVAVNEMVNLTSRLPVAERAFYEVPNRGAGMSIHIARELARIWGNIDYGVRELRRDDEAGVSEMQAWAWDQETNVRNTRSFLVPHQRMKRGQRQQLTDLGDIYLNNQNVGARAVRECIFAVLPGWYLSDAEVRLRSTLKNGDGRTLEERISDAIGKFLEADVTSQQLEDRIGKPSTRWSANDLATLVRIYTTITQDGIPAAEFFPEKPVEIPS